MELQIDTSTRYASVGLSIEGKSLVDIAWRSERNHSVELVPAINRAFDQAGARITDLDAVFTASGPGAFSALRVGMSTAKAIASTRGIPLVTVGTLDVEIQPFRVLDLPICAIASAGRNRLYVGRTVEGSDEIATEVQAVAEFLDHVSDGILYCGEAVLELAGPDGISGRRQRVSDSIGPTDAESVHHGVHGVPEARGRGETVDPSSAEPVYLRSSQIASAARRWGSGS